MKKINLWKNRKAIKLYATLAIIIISVFQVYWLTTVYQSRKAILVSEGENILKKALLDGERNAMVDLVLNSGIPHSSDADDVTRHLVNALKKNKEIKVSVSYEGDPEKAKELQRQLTDTTEVQEPKADDLSAEHKTEKLFYKVDPEIKSTLGGLNFYIVRHKQDKIQSYPASSLPVQAKTGRAYSSSDDKEYYELAFTDINTFIFQAILPSVLLSLLYMVICISAVIFLMIYVNKSKRLMQQKDNFTNNLTHEFKTPMSGISAGIEALITYDFLDDREKTLSYLGMMKSDLNRLINMTDSILYNAKMSDGKMHLNLENTQLYSFVTGITENMATVLKNKNATVTVANPGQEIYITADREHFGNVFRNLIDNAIKYSKEDAQITITLSRQGNFAKILFSDQGIGIPQKYKADIFKPYFRVIENDVYTVKGYGLGLSYIHEVVRMHKGKIRLATEKDETGTTFEIIIPLSNE